MDDAERARHLTRRLESFAGAIPFAFAFPSIGWLPYWTIPVLSALLRRFYRGLPAFARDVPGRLPAPSET